MIPIPISKANAAFQKLARSRAFECNQSVFLVRQGHAHFAVLHSVSIPYSDKELITKSGDRNSLCNTHSNRSGSKLDRVCNQSPMRFAALSPIRSLYGMEPACSSRDMSTVQQFATVRLSWRWLCVGIRLMRIECDYSQLVICVCFCVLSWQQWFFANCVHARSIYSTSVVLCVLSVSRHIWIRIFGGQVRIPKFRARCARWRNQFVGGGARNIFARGNHSCIFIQQARELRALFFTFVLRAQFWLSCVRCQWRQWGGNNNCCPWMYKKLYFFMNEIKN